MGPPHCEQVTSISWIAMRSPPPHRHDQRHAPRQREHDGPGVVHYPSLEWDVLFCLVDFLGLHAGHQPGYILLVLGGLVASIA